MTFQFLNPSQTSLLSTAGIGLQDRDAWTPLYSDVDLSLDRDAGIYWCHLQPQSRPSVTPELLRDVTSMQSFLRNRMAQTPENELPFKYFVVASRSTGIFNLGGDLRLFADAVRKGQASTPEVCPFLRRHRLEQRGQLRPAGRHNGARAG